MSEAKTITVTIKADTRALDESMDRLTRAFADFAYAAATTSAILTRLDRALWPTLPAWRRFWLTLRRKGWGWP